MPGTFISSSAEFEHFRGTGGQWAERIDRDDLLMAEGSLSRAPGRPVTAICHARVDVLTVFCLDHRVNFALNF